MGSMTKFVMLSVRNCPATYRVHHAKRAGKRLHVNGGLPCTFARTLLQAYAVARVCREASKGARKLRVAASAIRAASSSLPCAMACPSSGIAPTRHKRRQIYSARRQTRAAHRDQNIQAGGHFSAEAFSL